MLELGWTVNRLQKPRCVQIQVGSRKNFDADGYVEVCICFFLFIYTWYLFIFYFLGFKKIGCSC